MTLYTDQEIIDVSVDDNIYVCQEATGQYDIHQFKNWVGSELNCMVTCKLKCSLAPSVSTAYLQIYNRNSGIWETIDSDNSSSADTKFTLTAIVANFDDYKDINDIVSCRVYQLIT